MASISYRDIYSSFLSKVEAYDLTEMVEDKAYLMMEEWLKSIKSNPRVRKMFSTFTFDNEIQTLEFQLNHSQGDDESDVGYVIELLGFGIAWRWVTPKYLSILNTAQMLTGKEVKFYSQANHMAELKNMYNQTKTEFYNLIRDYGVLYNGYLSET